MDAWRSEAKDAKSRDRDSLCLVVCNSDVFEQLALDSLRRQPKRECHWLCAGQSQNSEEMPIQRERRDHRVRHVLLQLNL